MLGCTELSMLLDEWTLELKRGGVLLDTAELHAHAAVRFALGTDAAWGPSPDRHP